MIAEKSGEKMSESSQGLLSVGSLLAHCYFSVFCCFKDQGQLRLKDWWYRLSLKRRVYSATLQRVLDMGQENNLPNDIGLGPKNYLNSHMCLSFSLWGICFLNLFCPWNRICAFFPNECLPDQNNGIDVLNRVMYLLSFLLTSLTMASKTGPEMGTGPKLS
jgi:hypothetical protein